jgi:hypothetical protein
MGARVPVVCSAFANLGVAAKPEEHLLIAETATDYVCQVKRLLDSPDLAVGLGDRSFQFVRDNYSPAQFRDALLTACNAVLADPPFKASLARESRFRS